MKDIKVFLKKEEKRKQQYGQEQCKNLPGDEKQKLVEYIKQYCKMRKKYFIIIITSYFPFKFTSKSWFKKTKIDYQFTIKSGKLKMNKNWKNLKPYIKSW